MLSAPANQIHWDLTAIDAPASQMLADEIKVDVLVVGGGLTGCRTALGLAEAGVSVALVDAKDLGFGASGRSGGQCNPIWRKTPDELRAQMGAVAGDNLVKTTLCAADDLFSDIRKFSIDCDPVQSGWVQAAHTKSAIRSMSKLGDAWRKEGADIKELQGQEVQNVSGSPAYSFALRHASGGSVHPLSLTRGYAKAAVERGAHIFSHTPITQLERVDGRWQAHAAKGKISAENVVLSTNAYTDDLWPKLKRTITPLASVMLATSPLSAEQQEVILPDRITISDSRLAIYFARYDRDGRLLFGCVGSGDHVDTFGGYKRLKTGLATVFPDLRDVPIESKWAGRIAVRPDMMPRMFELAPGVIAGMGFSGRGIAMTSVMGRTLAAKILGAKSSDLAFPLSEISTIPFHGISSQFVPLIAPSMTLRDRFDTLTQGV